MTAHWIEQALAEGGNEVRSRPAVRRIWVDAPYIMAKTLIISAVAKSNDCFITLSKEWGFVTLVGHDADLASTDLLSTSLLVQATRAMTATGSHVTHRGRSRTRSFRHAFLVAYAGRICERLSEAKSVARLARVPLTYVAHARRPRIGPGR